MFTGALKGLKNIFLIAKSTYEYLIPEIKV